jgi:hypothetical protein
MPAVERRSEKTEDPARAKGQASGAQQRGGEAAPELALEEPGALDARMLLHLQRTVGNQAVAQLVAQRQARAGPAADPKFQALTRDVKGKQHLLGAHRPGRATAADAQGAAHAPPDDKEAQAKTAQAGKMAAAKPGDFDKAAFIGAVNAAIAAQAPKTLDDADKFAGSGKADQIKGQVQGHVTEGKKASAGQIDSTTRATPDTSVAVEKKVTPLDPDRPPGTPAAPNPSQAVPDRAPAAATDLSAGPKQVNEEMAQAEVTEPQLAKSNEPEFEGALKQKKEAEEHSATAPGQVRASEARTLDATKAEAATTGAAAMGTMAAHRTQAGARVGEGQQTTKGSDESKRAQVTATLQKVFDATKTDVEGILSGLDHKVDQQFDAEEGEARRAFTADMQKRMDDYKSQRYGGFMGKLRWVKDQFMGLPPEANQIFVTARAGYVARMQQVISRIADTIGAELTRAKARIAQGRAQLEAEVHKLPADLQALGQQAAAGFDTQFEELTASVDAKGQELVQTLASKYSEALKAVDAQIEEEKARNQGLVAKAVGAVKGVIETIIQLKNLLLGVLAKAAQAIGAILKDPIGFLGHLVSAVGAGLRAFIANIGEHLKKGLVSWLLGAAAQAGIQLPDRFDLKGIVQLVASLLGLTWQSIRGRIASRGVPDQAITAAEQSVPEAQLLAREGLPGLWQQITSKLGDLKAMILGRLAEFLIPTVLVAGITWIISLLNPASAFVKAVKAIIDIVTFIFERGAQILEFVNSVLDAIIAIAAGGVAGVPALIENALAKSIPVLIGFLAALLGVGGLADKVKSVIQAISRPVMKVVDWVVDKIAGVAKKFWAKLKGAFGKKDGKDKKAGAGAPGQLKLQEAFAMHGAGHTLYATSVNGRVRVTMASYKRQYLGDLINLAQDEERKGANRPEVFQQFGVVRAELEQAERLELGLDEKVTKATEDKAASLLTDIAGQLRDAGEVYGFTSLRGLGHPSRWVAAGELRNEYRGVNFRTKVYRGFTSESTRFARAELVRLKAMKSDPRWAADPKVGLTGAWVCPGNGVRPAHIADANGATEDLTLDHRHPVSRHWRDRGHDCNDGERSTWENDRSNLEAMCRSCNSSKGGDTIDDYRVGPFFRGYGE